MPLKLRPYGDIKMYVIIVIKPQISEKQVDVCWQIKLSDESLGVGMKRSRSMVVHQVHVDTMFLRQLKCCTVLQTVQQQNKQATYSHVSDYFLRCTRWSSKVCHEQVTTSAQCGSGSPAGDGVGCLARTLRRT